ncbi:uncharacterized protein LOC123525595 [Mercenaria mercenaria]|uniref:uncharacterized protein LOC123525595 n=1 Tax=Mercenaria mercenaria TaxID=6596 RepID=UPI00234EE26E|nr:uncharacterized protein LOC123525595 [Mercenaria mercenaria]
MKTATCVTIYLCIATVNCFVSNNINHLVKKICRGEQSCSEDNITLLANSCCRPCECEDFCQEKGTCCDGNSSNRIENVTAQVCLLAGLERSSIDRRNTQLSPYFVRAHCPKSFTNHSTRDKCETSTPESIEDGVFVSSKNGKIVYKNRHCALCHGEEDPIMWAVGVDEKCVRDVFLSRSDTHHSLNASYMNEKLMTSCTITFDRPSITSWKHVVCAYEGLLISSCPDLTSQKLSSDGIDKELNELCLKDNSALSVFHGKWQYANVYCYLCNRQKAAVCDTENPDKVIQSIILLLDLSLLRMGKISPEEEEKEHQCTGHTFYDELFDTCREIRCQMFDVASEGKCVSIVQKGEMNYAFNFELVPKHPLNHQQWNRVDIREVLDALSTFQSKLGFRKCRRCSVNVRYNLNPTMQYKTYSHVKFYLQFVFTATPYCERKYLLSRAEWLENGQLPVPLAQNITLTARYIWSRDKYTNITKSLITVYHKNRCLRIVLDPSRFANCPKITLSLDEFVKIGNLTSTQQLKAVRNEYDGFDVCLDEYKRYVGDIKSYGAETRCSPSFVLMPLFLIFIVLK